MFPINQFPPEVLTEVFKNCIPKPGDFTGTPTNVAPLLLCRVCSLWRTSAQSTPELWKMMNICITRETEVGLEDVARFITTCLERSGTLPLTIHVKIPTLIPKATIHPIFTSLREHASRWESVSIQQPYSSCVISPTTDELPLLQCFKFSYGRNHSDEHPSLPFVSAPRLTSLRWPHLLPVIEYPSVPWHRLRHVEFRSGLSPYTVVEILRNCPELLELNVSIDKALGSDGLLPCKSRVLHRQLCKFDIMIGEGCALLLDSLTLPALRDLSLLTYTSPADNPAVQTLHEQLLRLFSRSECTLNKLSLLLCRFDASMLQECFRHKSLAMLTRLEIEARDPSKSMFTDDVLCDLTCIPCAGYGMLIPKLSSLSLRNCLSASPGTLGRMILSRCPGPEKEGDRLKHFLLVEQRLHADDKEYIDEACLQGLIAKLYV
ncbi:hypothetical protein AX17_003138 [Amanita inopinata Kibby_2008]|nr:hypothetical protein AX17_003138 [Amanita inopinata Kibby_2008]